MIARFTLDRVHKSPAVFDSFKLRWLNRQYVAAAPLEERLDYYRSIVKQYVVLQEEFLSEAEFTRNQSWIDRVIKSVIVDRVERIFVQDVFRLVCDYDSQRILRQDETRNVADEPGAREVLKAFIPKVLEAGELTYPRFREIAKSVQKETGKKGKDLFHPIRVAVTGAVSGPELEKLIPIFEEGAKLPLARHVKSVSERLREFVAAAKL
jgi:glutamyl-tRNA synthetase/nondiscriminating glutamyl-tRNA synthetase